MVKEEEKNLPWTSRIKKVLFNVGRRMSLRGLTILILMILLVKIEILELTDFKGNSEIKISDPSLDLLMRRLKRLLSKFLMEKLLAKIK